MSKRMSSWIDRRSIVDRRKVYSLDYFSEGGGERRRHGKDRRWPAERRFGWIRTGSWHSVYPFGVSRVRRSQNRITSTVDDIYVL